MTTINTIPNFSKEPPSTSDPYHFDERADAAFADLHDSIIPDMNTSIGQMNTVADEVESNKTATDSNKEDCENAETIAIAARDKAEKWANEAENVEVETGKYSALHFAAKAEAAVAVLPEGTIDDGLIATDKAWSSDKINKSLIGISPRIYFMGGF